MKPRFLLPALEWTVIPFLNIAGWLLEKLGGKSVVFAANFSVWARK
jgi:hypothetical protein